MLLTRAWPGSDSSRRGTSAASAIGAATAASASGVTAATAKPRPTTLNARAARAEGGGGSSGLRRSGASPVLLRAARSGETTPRIGVRSLCSRNEWNGPIPVPPRPPNPGAVQPAKYECAAQVARTPGVGEARQAEGLGPISHCLTRSPGPTPSRHLARICADACRWRAKVRWYMNSSGVAPRMCMGRGAPRRSRGHPCSSP